MFVRDQINNPRICTLRNLVNMREDTEDVTRIPTATIVILILHSAKRNLISSDALDAGVCGLCLLDVLLFHRFGFRLSRC